MTKIQDNIKVNTKYITPRISVAPEKPTVSLPLSRISQYFTEPEATLKFSQETYIDHYLEPD
jgi:translation initiation factor 2 alpha subunit (eIF-2alpha)